MINSNEIIMTPLDIEWVRRAHPLLMILKGGHRAKAGEWFLEVNRVLNDIYQSFVILENFMNRDGKDIFIGESKDKIEMSETEKLWLTGYVIENTYLRIGSCLDKIAQMIRVYYEHPDNGGPLSIYPRCGNCPPGNLTESNCSFGAILSSLHKKPRNSIIDNALFKLEKSATISDIKKVRNDISHRINKNLSILGIDPNIEVKIDGKKQTTTFRFGHSLKNLNEYRLVIANTYNELTDHLNNIGPILFPGKPEASA